MQVQNISHMFSLNFELTTQELKDACTRKEREIRAKIEEREGRVTRVRSEYKITDAVLVDLLTQARAANKRNDAMTNYTSNAQIVNNEGEFTMVTVGAGVVNMLMTERDFIDGERSQADKLALIARSLRNFTDDRGIARSSHRVSYEELRFLGL